MRDPERIDLILDAVRSIWKRNPDQRLLQLLVNLCGPTPNPLFYVEDRRLLEVLDRYADDHTWRGAAASPPSWLLDGHAPPPEIAHRLTRIRDDIKDDGGVRADHIASVIELVLGLPSSGRAA